MAAEIAGETDRDRRVHNDFSGKIERNIVNMLRLQTAALAVMLALASPLVSAEIQTDRPVTLQDCIDYSLENHNSVLAAYRDYDASQANVTRARAGFMPRLTVGTSYNRSGYEGDSIRIGDGSDHQSQIGVTQTIFDGGRTSTSIKQASAARRAVDADVERIIQERILAVTTAYFDVLRTKKLADIAAQSVHEAEGQRELIQARIDEGDAAKVDIYPVEVQLANARLQQLQAENNARVALSGLRNAMGLVGNQNFSLADVTEPEWEVSSLDECTACALEERPELERSAAQIDSSKASLSLARLQRLPVPTAGVSYDRGINGTSYDSQWSVGMGLSLNLFDGGAAAAEVDSARCALDSTVLRDDQTRQDIRKEVEEAYLNLGSLLERLEASRSNVELARTNLEVANEKYQLGMAIPLEVVSAQISNADAQINHAQALYDCYIARARLAKAMGRREY